MSGFWPGGRFGYILFVWPGGREAESEAPGRGGPGGGGLLKLPRGAYQEREGWAGGAGRVCAGLGRIGSLKRS